MQPLGPRAVRKRPLYLLMSVFGELLGLSLVFLQFYGTQLFHDCGTDGRSYSLCLRNYMFCFPLATGLLLIVNSSLAIFVQLLDMGQGGCSFCPKLWVGPMWILTATVSVVLFTLSVSFVVKHSSGHEDTKQFHSTLWATMFLSAVSIVFCYVQACCAFFAGHACCYCYWNRKHVEDCQHYHHVQDAIHL
jgi:hypothetical protein